MVVARKLVPTKIVAGTVTLIVKDSYQVLGSDRNIYRVIEKCKKDLDAYKAQVGGMVTLVFVEHTQSVIMAMPTDLFKDVEVPASIEVTA